MQMQMQLLLLADVQAPLFPISLNMLPLLELLALVAAVAAVSSTVS